MSDTPKSLIVLSFEDARRVVEEHAAKFHPRGKELTPLLGAVGMILAEPVFADRDFPPFRRAARDGYALRSADLENIPATLEIIGEIKAGAPENLEMRVEKGQAVSIMTGAAAPTGADAVVMIEYTSRKDNQVDVNRSVGAGENIVSHRLGSQAWRPVAFRWNATGSRLHRRGSFSWKKSRAGVFKTPNRSISDGGRDRGYRGSAGSNSNP